MVLYNLSMNCEMESEMIHDQASKTKLSPNDCTQANSGKGKTKSIQQHKAVQEQQQVLQGAEPKNSLETVNTHGDCRQQC